MTVGGIGEKPGVVDGYIAIRDYLSLTISFDHETIDGAPAARFTQRLKELIESGYGLGDSTVEPEQAGAEYHSHIRRTGRCVHAHDHIPHMGQPCRTPSKSHCS